MASSTTTIVAEYAKSNRSSCKKCSETIPAKSLRLGLVTKDPRGFDATKWHHLNCFSHSIPSLESVDGFSHLQSDDQEALKKLAESFDGLEEKEGNEEEKVEVQGKKKSRKTTEVSKEDEVEEVEDKEKKSSKKLKLSSVEKTEAEISSSKVKDEYKIVAEYAKSNRSSCKKCSETIPAKSLRLGSVTRDPRGFDATKWHHLNCFSQPIWSLESINGFSLLQSDDQSDDQDALKNLVAASGDGSEEKEVLKDEKIGDGEAEDMSSKKLKLSSVEKIEAELCFSSSEVKDEYKIVAEYAKSNRSSCKKCSKAIPAKSLRIGLVTRDPRGFETTKWHHLNCFSQPIRSLESVNGFSLLQSDDQEALNKLVAPSDGSEEKEVLEEEEIEHGEGKENSSKKVKLSLVEETGIEIHFSSSEVKDEYKDSTLLPKWKAFQTIIFLERDEGLHDSSKIAAFDFDGCLAKTSLKRTGPDAWSLMYSSIPEKLKSLYDDGYKLVIFTNESNIDRWKNKRQVAVNSKIGRLNNFIKCVNVPIQVFIACGYGQQDLFRKPKPGMWRIMERHFNSDITIDMDQSFYVGDAAGRADDHSDADIKFAQAIGLKFHVPEDYFAV